VAHDESLFVHHLLGVRRNFAASEGALLLGLLSRRGGRVSGLRTGPENKSGHGEHGE
jgi:hypothetical protein